MKKGRNYSRSEIELISKSVIGKSMNDILKEEGIVANSSISNKGGLGQMVEKYLFGITTNSDSEPDFIKAGIELKVTPYRKLKDGKISAKERLVLNIIDYMSEYKNSFKSSHFWLKNNTIQLIWYLYESDKDIIDFKFTHEKILELEFSKDLKQIEKDWKLIVKKIKEGKAHELSEADTMYLGACTKGENSKSLRQQPFSFIPAMQRAFCFKNSYMTQLVRKYIGDYFDVEKILTGTTETFDEYVDNVVGKYKGKTQKQLMEEFCIDSSAKNVNSILVSRMFGVKGNLGNTEEFQKANIIPKTIRIEENGSIIESISFPAFKFVDIAKQEWETCDLKEELETTKYMFFVFKKENGEYIFKGIKLWNMPELDIESSVMEMWKSTYNTIINGNIVKEIKDGKRRTNFIGMSENRVCHVRPHGRDANDVNELPVPDKLTGVTEYTKQCFWINSSYIEKFLKEFN